MHTHIYVYIYIHIHIHTYMDTYTYTYAHTCTYTYIYIHMPIHIYIYISLHLSHMHILQRVWSKCVRWCSQNLSNVHTCTCMVRNNTCKCMPTLCKKCIWTRVCAPIQLCSSFVAMEAIANLSWVLREHRVGCCLLTALPLALLPAIRCVTLFAQEIRPNPRQLMTRSPLRCCTSIIRSSALVQDSSSLSIGRTCACPRRLPVTEMHFRHFSRECVCVCVRVYVYIYTCIYACIHIYMYIQCTCIGIYMSMYIYIHKYVYIYIYKYIYIHTCEYVLHCYMNITIHHLYLFFWRHTFSTSFGNVFCGGYMYTHVYKYALTWLNFPSFFWGRPILVFRYDEPSLPAPGSPPPPRPPLRTPSFFVLSDVS